MFIDEIDLEVSGGRGGDGIVAFLRLKFMPHGGPAGGDGGRGGSVIFEADENLNTLYDLYRVRRIRAENGQPGGNNNRAGKGGEDRVVKLPVGTVVYDKERGVILKDLSRHGQRVVIAHGGKGGKGNKHFATPTRQVPRLSEPGRDGQQRRLHLELKLLADVGLVGLPNAGKSTLLSTVSAATPKIADYPFTTLMPQLGIVALDPARTFVMADLPGLIEGASQGQGLGDRFLRHIERTRLILHLVDCSSGTPDELAESERVIAQELAQFSQRLATLPRLRVGTKLDLPEAREAFAEWSATGETFGIASATGDGVQALMQEVWQRLARLRREEQDREPAEAGEDELPDLAPDGTPADVDYEPMRMDGLSAKPPHIDDEADPSDDASEA